ncbi:hypothetical protein TVAG_074360 [Trichomonas vaginalis G3]|uniref:Importin N-terminal domain-containing protein n=1 Tax=Trichomonas vaginalis (strain ATCC PRA-98 / G3) TaxID=412133 RepID=A2E3V3_TRIV3|nr:armadillo (ARM) repeat-containing protein family [Trichomonas vaginalis G3]EAY12608.1 hypothetical protein TVAG_074360 [Trichomonas vaginalis G3]KAI5546971.1 armadillo (ARM) repeat-containing protein family [Trichomonas vaginalis G3]|eukprot:XP_001324831.1 hypothetical protein [Trichomonas vaginalis G3]
MDEDYKVDTDQDENRTKAYKNDGNNVEEEDVEGYIDQLKEKFYNSTDNLIIQIGNLLNTIQSSTTFKNMSEPSAKILFDIITNIIQNGSSPDLVKLSFNILKRISDIYYEEFIEDLVEDTDFIKHIVELYTNFINISPDIIEFIVNTSQYGMENFMKYVDWDCFKERFSENYQEVENLQNNEALLLYKIAKNHFEWYEFPDFGELLIEIIFSHYFTLSMETRHHLIKCFKYLKKISRDKWKKLVIESNSPIRAWEMLRSDNCPVVAVLELLKKISSLCGKEMILDYDILFGILNSDISYIQVAALRMLRTYVYSCRDVILDRREELYQILTTIVQIGGFQAKSWAVKVICQIAENGRGQENREIWNLGILDLFMEDMGEYPLDVQFSVLCLLQNFVDFGFLTEETANENFVDQMNEYLQSDNISESAEAYANNIMKSIFGYSDYSDYD